MYAATSGYQNDAGMSHVDANYYDAQIADGQLLEDQKRNIE